jgi:hypothetical protein
MAAPSMPNDFQIVQPDPSLPKELAAFFGKWEGELGGTEFFLIVEKINEKKASLYTFRSGLGWVKYEAIVRKERGNYKLWFEGRSGTNELTLRGELLDLNVPPGSKVLTLRRVP